MVSLAEHNSEPGIWGFVNRWRLDPFILRPALVLKGRASSTRMNKKKGENENASCYWETVLSEGWFLRSRLSPLPLTCVRLGGRSAQLMRECKARGISGAKVWMAEETKGSSRLADRIGDVSDEDESAFICGG